MRAAVESILTSDPSQRRRLLPCIAFDTCPRLTLVHPLGTRRAPVLMVVALFNGMAHHEASVVVSTYYIALTLNSSLQGVCVFQLLTSMDAGEAAGFCLGVLLCVLAVCWSSWRRHQQERAANRALLDSSRLLDEQAREWGLQPASGAASGGAPLTPVVESPAGSCAPLEAGGSCSLSVGSQVSLVDRAPATIASTTAARHNMG